ncbi:hypothetical protein ACHAXT_001816 [Thalassiosira profunda]
MNPLPFAALHPTPSRLTSTASSSQRTATTAANSSFMESDASASPRDEDGAPREDGARLMPLAAAMAAEEDDADDFVNVTSEDAWGGAGDDDRGNMNVATGSSAEATRITMRFIAHRGNLNGPNPTQENQPQYLLAALAQGFDVEVDAWHDPATDNWALGHDAPLYPIEYEFLRQKGVWAHAKNTAALREMVKDPCVHCFAHDKDEYTLTSRGYIWAYPDVELAGRKCIAVMYSEPEKVLGLEIGGVCHDHVAELRERYDEMMTGRGMKGVEGGDVDEGDDRKPAAVPNFGDGEDDRKPVAKPTESSGGSIVAGDNRFVCAICLETVSDAPVVTRCGHLYCWTCLYQWLQPGMLLSEYRAAFGGGAPASNNAGGLNFLSSSYNHPQSDRPYNPAGRPYNEQRRCCPICKAGCTVDTVVPIYIHVHGEDAAASLGEEGTMLRGDESTRGIVSRDSLNSLDVDYEPEPAADTESAAAASSAAATAPGDALDSLEDPSMANLGLRNRRRTTASSNQQEQRQQSTAQASSSIDPFSCESPTRTQKNQHGGSAMSMHNTPVHRNSSSALQDDGSGRGNGSSAEVPSRPIPTTATRNAPDRQFGVRPDVSQPNLSERAHSNIASSSPFRVALRPRHQSRTLTPPTSRHPFAGGLPPSGQAPGHVPFSRAYANQHHRHGGLTSALLGIVDAVDNLAASRATAGGTGSGQLVTPAVPQLHRSDGGLGGIGRASERDANADANDLGNGGINGEDSSLATAREFLSRLLLMLACFVILCLLLF